MDLGAFLHAGRKYPVLVTDVSASHNRAVEGSLSLRRGRPFWRLSAPVPPGALVTISFHLAGFRLAPDGALYPAAPDEAAPLVLAGRVRACRFCTFFDAYALHLDLLGRVLPA